MRSINTIEQVESIRAQLVAEGAPGPEIIRHVALACLGWPYVFGAWGEQCTPSGRKRRARDDHPTIRSKCPALNGKDCSACKWGIGVRMFDCRGFTRWLIQQAGGDISGAGATSQYNTAANWLRRGPISEMPDVVCCVFRKKGSSMEHTGMHIGGGTIIHCSSGVQTGSADKSWTHYAIPKGLYDEGAIPVTIVRPTLRKGASGDLVADLQRRLDELGYHPGGADGKFGTNTRNALIQFQTDSNLQPDGVCGPKTWAALDAATVRDTYRVICEGVSWGQYMKIRDICPTAEAEVERSEPNG